MISLIIVSGGVGARMGSPIPKQYLTLQSKPIARYSFELFLSLSEIDEIIVVCDPLYQEIFSTKDPRVQFALPGKRRQDSVYNGFCKTSSPLILTHDSARPFVEKTSVLKLIEVAEKSGAAALAAPSVNTTRQTHPNSTLVEKTLDRSLLWQIQTPQALRRDLFEKGFELIHKNNLDITDELMIAELLGHPVEVVPSSEQNFKITTPFDLAVAETLLSSHVPV